MNKLSSAVLNLYSRIKAADYMFVIRFCVAIILAWYLSYYLELDKPYWAMMTVNIVSLPSPGSSIIKLIARLIGTSIGVIAITPIVYMSQYDPWLMSILIALWVGICHYICCCYYGSVSYCFALSGYTSAIIGFATVSSPSSYTLFFTSQARFTEITLGLFIVFVLSFIFPSNKDQQVLIQSEQKLHKTLVDILKEGVLTSSSAAQSIMKNITGFVLQIMNIKVLATQYIFSSTNTSEKGIQAISAIYNSFNTLGSLIMLKIMKEELITKEPNINEIVKQHEQSIEQGIALSTQDLNETSQDIYLNNFYKEFDQTTTSIVKPSEKIIEDDDDKNLFLIRGYHDQKEAIYNGLRTFLIIMCGVFFWLNGNWEYGYIGVIFLAVVCCYLSMIPMIKIAIFFAALGLIVGIIVAYVLRFGIFIGISEYILAVIVFSAVIIFFSYIQIIFSPIWALFSFVTIQVIIFSISFQNPMNYDFASFANISLMILFSMLVMIGVVYLLPPSPEKNIISRMEKAINKKFTKYLHNKTSFTQFKIYLATVINEAKFVMSPELKDELIAKCINKFLIAYVINKNCYSLLRHPKILTAFENKQHELVLEYIKAEHEQENNEEIKIFWWKLGCVLKRAY